MRGMFGGNLEQLACGSQTERGHNMLAHIRSHARGQDLVRTTGKHAFAKPCLERSTVLAVGGCRGLSQPTKDPQPPAIAGNHDDGRSPKRHVVPTLWRVSLRGSSPLPRGSVFIGPWAQRWFVMTHDRFRRRCACPRATSWDVPHCS